MPRPAQRLNAGPRSAATEDAPVYAAKQYQQGKDTLLAVCDEDCLGKTYSEGKLTLHVDPAFYDGDRIDRDEFGRLFQGATIANLVGPQCVEAGIEMGFIDKAHVIEIDGVPHAQWTIMFG